MSLPGSVFLFLVVLALLFVAVDLPLGAGLCILAAFFIAVVKAGSGTAAAGKAIGKTLAAGVRQDVSKAKGAVPDTSVFVKGFENAGELTAQQLHAPDTHQFKYKGIGAVGEACQRMIEYFKKLFG